MNILQITVPDIEAAKAFYTEFFGNTGKTREDASHSFHHGNLEIRCVDARTFESDTDGVIFGQGSLSIVTDRLEDLHRLAMDNLCKEVDEDLLQDRHGFQFFSMTDPFGNRIRFVQAKAHAA
jgi:catechol 2,3-dioxygenase-like lactoylglutathione lyase family enzyme